jgi:hypothetical protein
VIKAIFRRIDRREGAARGFGGPESIDRENRFANFTTSPVVGDDGVSPQFTKYRSRRLF